MRGLEETQPEISMGQMLFGVIVTLIVMAALMRIGFTAGRVDAILDSITREVR